VKNELGMLLARIMLSILFVMCYLGTNAFAVEPTAVDSIKISMVVDAIKKTGLHVKGRPRNGTVVLPQPLVGNQWGLTNHACKKAGYDLVPYAGQQVKSSHYNLYEDYSGYKVELIVLTNDYRCICIYEVVPGLIPGIIAVNDPSIK